MRKIYFFFLCIFLFGNLAAQQSHEITHIEQREIQNLAQLDLGKVNGTVDTVYDYFDRATVFYFLSAGAAGYTLGTNSFTSEIGVQYDALGETKVTELMVFFTHKEIINGIADSVVANFYECSADSMPATLMGTGKLSVAEIDTTGFATFIPLTVTDSTLGSFFVSIDYDNNGANDDTVVVLSSNVLASNGGPDGNQEKRTRQKTGTGWLTCWDIWNFGGNPFDADAMILPIVDYTQITGLNNGVKANSLTLFPAFPNPSSETIHLPYELDKKQKVQLTVYDLQGRPVFESDVQQKSPGKHQFDLPTSGLATGQYYYRLLSEKGALAGKFMVGK